MDKYKLSFSDTGLIPCIVQDAKTKDVLMMAYMNEESLKRTLETHLMWFWSRSRKKLWCKGETSGNIQELVELRYDCDADTLLAHVNPQGPSCHTGEKTCFFRTIDF
jgi:phosphoribosyl-AMP cyclohydrolase